MRNMTLSYQVFVIWILLFYGGISAEDLNAKLEVLFEDGDNVTNLYGKHEIIVVVGGTGTGKSTLSKFLRRDSNLIIGQNAGEEYVFTDNEVRIGNNNSHQSKTLFPHVDLDSLSGELLVDLAGFQDTRHAIFDLLAAFFNKKVLNSANRIKIVVVENFNRMRISEDRAAFITTIRNLALLLPEDVQGFNDSIALVATKVDVTKSDGNIRRSVLKFLDATIEAMNIKQQEAVDRKENQEAQLLTKMIQLIQFMNNMDRIGLFRRPNEIGNPYFLQPLADNWELLRDIIFSKLVYSEPKSENFQISVAPATVNYIKDELIEPAEEKLKRVMILLSNNMTSNIAKTYDMKTTDKILIGIARNLDAYQQYNALVDGINSTENFLEFGQSVGIDEAKIRMVRLQKSKIEFYRSVIRSRSTVKHEECYTYGKEILAKDMKMAHNFYLFLTRLSEVAQKYEFLIDYAPFQGLSTKNFREFAYNLPRVDAYNSLVNLATDIQISPIQLKALNRFINEIITNDFDIVYGNNFISIQGKYVFLSNVIKYNIKSTNEVRILAKNKVFLDADMELVDTHLVIAAPIIEVVTHSTRTLTLRGSNGANFGSSASKAASYNHKGSNGQQGRRGFSSGNLIIMALDLVNVNQLKIKSIGGDGSSGQNGGNGLDGVKSRPPFIPDGHWGIRGQLHKKAVPGGYEMSVGEISYTGDRTSIATYFYNEYIITVSLPVTVTNKNGARKPTGGGDGGKGGAGALPGQHTIHIQTGNTLNVEDTAGKTGLAGVGGMAGKTVPMCTKNKYVCTAKRIEKFAFLIRMNKHEYEFNYDCSFSFTSECSENFPNAANGRKGDNTLTTDNRIHHKIAHHSAPDEVIAHFCNFIVKSSLISNESLSFMRYLFTPGMKTLMGSETKASTKRCQVLATSTQ